MIENETITCLVKDNTVRLGGTLFDCIVNEVLIECSVEPCVNEGLLSGWLLAFCLWNKPLEYVEIEAVRTDFMFLFMCPTWLKNFLWIQSSWCFGCLLYLPFNPHLLLAVILMPLFPRCYPFMKDHSVSGLCSLLCHVLPACLPASLRAATKTVQSESNQSDKVKSAVTEKCKWRMIRKELSRQERNIWRNWSKTAIVVVVVPWQISDTERVPLCLHKCPPLSMLDHWSCIRSLFYICPFAYVKLRL